MNSAAEYFSEYSSFGTELYVPNICIITREHLSLVCMYVYVRIYAHVYSIHICTCMRV